MPFYAGLKDHDRSTRRRTVDALLTLRAQLEKDVPTRTGEDTLLLATWNIREFDSAKYGARCTESLYLIAEILDHFDLIAVQEVRADLKALKDVMALLGKWWDVIFTDVTYGPGGNDERMAFLFDTRKLRFSGLAGEVVLPDRKGVKATQLARTPFICGFKCSWISFDICTVHTYYGSAKADEPRRLKEIQNLATTLASRVDAGDAQNIILLGDFNIFSRRDKTFKALIEAGFSVPTQIMSLKGSNIKQDKEYDQIAFLERKRWFVVKRAGIFNFYRSVFRDADEAVWKPVMGDAKKYKDWRTYQMSDHLPMWVELAINHTESYLRYLRTWTKATPHWSDGTGGNASTFVAPDVRSVHPVKQLPPKG